MIFATSILDGAGFNRLKLEADKYQSRADGFPFLASARLISGASIVTTPISSSDLSEATIKALAVDGLTTIEALLPMSRLDLLRIPGIGRKSVAGISEVLRAHIPQASEAKESRDDCSRSARWTGRLPCVRCASEAHLMRINPAEPGIRLLTYECTVCGDFNVVRAAFPAGRSERPLAT